MAAPNQDLFDSYFRRADLDGDGQISGAEAVAFFQGSNLPKNVLAQVWMFADSKKVGYLTRTEFYNALKLVTVAQSKRELTPDIVNAALFSPSSAKIPAPQINLAATPSPQPKVAPPIAHAGGPVPAPSQTSGFRGSQFGGKASGNDQYAPSQQNQYMRPPQVMPPATSQPQQTFANQNFVSGGTMGAFRPTNPPVSTDWLGGRADGSLGQVNSQVPNKGNTNSSLNQDAYGLTASGVASSNQPRQQLTMGPMHTMQPKSQDPAIPSNRSADEDSKALVVSGNGFPSDSLFGDVFAATPTLPKQSPATSSASGSTVSARSPPAPAAAQTSVKPSSPDSLRSPLGQHPGSGNNQQNQSTGRPPQLSAGFPVRAAHLASSQLSQLPWPKMSQADVQKYSKVFVQVDTDKDGKISGDQARNLFLSWRLPREVLKQVWDLSDQDNDSMLSLKEFCVALYLMERYREGRPLPSVLPSTIMPGDTVFATTGQLAAPHGSATWGPPQGFQQQQVPSASRPPPAPRGKPPRPVPLPQGDGARQPTQQKSKVPVLEKHLVDQLSKEEQDLLNSKFQEATAVEKKVEELEKEIAESKQKIEFYRVKMQEIVLYKSRCDNRLNEITERVSADKKEVDSLSKKYEDKYKQSGGAGNKLTLEEATFRDVQEKKMGIYQSIVKLEEGDLTDGVIKERAEVIQSGLEELVSTLNGRCKQYGLRGKPMSLVELPFGWQYGIQEEAADWDNDWDKFEEEGFTFVNELTLDVQNVIAPPKPKLSLVRKGQVSSTTEGSNKLSLDADGMTEKVSSPDKQTAVKESVFEELDSSDKTPGSPAGDKMAEEESQEIQDSNNTKSSESDSSPHNKNTSDHGHAESTQSGDKSFDEPSWGTFDGNDDTDSVWEGEHDNGKDDDDRRDSFGFGFGDFSIKPIRTGSTNGGDTKPGKSLFADSVSGTPLYNFENTPHSFSELPEFSMFTSQTPQSESKVTRNVFADSVPGTPAYNFENTPRGLPGNIFADSVPSTPAYNFENTPRGPNEDNYSFDSFSRFDSFNNRDSIFAQSPSYSFSRNDSVRSTNESDYFASKFDSFNAQKFDSFNAQNFDSFSAQESGPNQSPRNLGRFDSMRSTGDDADYSHGFAFDDADPFGSSGPFKTSGESNTPKSSDKWSAF